MYEIFSSDFPLDFQLISLDDKFWFYKGVLLLCKDIKYKTRFNISKTRSENRKKSQRKGKNIFPNFSESRGRKHYVQYIQLSFILLFVETTEIETPETPAETSVPATLATLKIVNEIDIEIEISIKATKISEPEASKILIKRKRVAAGTTIKSKCPIKPSLNKRDVHVWAYDRYGERLKINGQEKLVLDVDNEDIILMRISKRRN